MRIGRRALAGLLTVILSVSVDARSVDPRCSIAADLLWSGNATQRSRPDAGTARLRRPAYVHYELLPVCKHLARVDVRRASRAIMHRGLQTSASDVR